MNELEGSLKFQGLTRIEVKVYLKLLELNQTKVGDLAKITGITRTQLYPLLEKMVEKGYIKQIGSKPVRYEALDSRKLIKLLREERRKQIDSLSELESKLNEIKPVQKVPGIPYKVYLIKGENNILRKLIELWKGVKKEVIRTGAFERELLNEFKKLTKINKEKTKKGIKNTVYLSIKPENLYKIKELERMFMHATFGGLIKEQPYTIIIFDRKYVVIVFYNFHKKEYDSAFYFENPDLAEAFASKNIAPIESYPLKGEVRVTTIGGERAFLIPPVLDSISKKEQYKLGYGVGWYGIKPLKNLNHSMNSLMLMLKMQIMMSGWGKAKIVKTGKKEVVLSLENSVVTPAFMKGNIVGFLSVMGDYTVKERMVDRKKKHYEFAIKSK